MAMLALLSGLAAAASLFNEAQGAVFLHRNASRQWPPIQVACIGDSITEGVPGPLEHSYPARLQEMLGQGYLVRNFGKGWASLMPPLPTFPAPVHAYETTAQFGAAVAFHPSIAVVMLGTNDAFGTTWNQKRSETFVWYYTTFINNLRKLSPMPRILMMVPPPCYSMTGSSGGGNNQTVINTILPSLIRQVAQATGVAAPIDAFSRFSANCPDFTKGSTCSWIADAELHPNAHGYYQIADLVKQAIVTGL